jgi:hypothetical protein
MELAAITLIVNGTIALMQALPALIKAINEMSISSDDKEILKKRIFEAQSSLPVWE